MIEVRRAGGMVKRRDEIDGFPGAMTRPRAAYDAMHHTWPVSYPPYALVDAMQSGDRLGYHPEKAADEIAHFRTVLSQARDALDEIAKDFPQRVEEVSKRPINGISADAFELERQPRQDAMVRAQKQLAEVGK